LKIKSGASKVSSGQIDRPESSINATALFFSPNAICFNFKFGPEFLKGDQSYLLLYTKIPPILLFFGGGLVRKSFFLIAQCGFTTIEKFDQSSVHPLEKNSENKHDAPDRDRNQAPDPYRFVE